MGPRPRSCFTLVVLPVLYLLAALDKHSDVRAAAERVEAAERQAELAQANRAIDVSVGPSWQHNFAMAGDPDQPATDLVGASLSIPLPFSRIYKGELEAAPGLSDRPSTSESP